MTLAVMTAFPLLVPAAYIIPGVALARFDSSNPPVTSPKYHRYLQYTEEDGGTQKRTVGHRKTG